MDIVRAAGAGDLERVRVHVEQRPERVHAQDMSEETPLLRAARGGHTEVVRYLIGAGADIDHRDMCRWTPLDWACRNGHAGVVWALLQRGADVTAVSEAGLNALIIAARDGRDAVVRLLLEHGGSDVDAVDNDGWTALHDACINGHAGSVQQLLEAGADATLRDVHGRTAVDLAANDGHHTCVRIIQEWGQAYLLQRARRVRDAALTSAPSAPQHSS